MLGQSLGEGNGTLLQYSCLENPTDGGAWQAAVHGVGKSRTRLSGFTFTFIHWRRKWQPTPVFLLGESQRWGSLVGCHLQGCTESDTTKATQQQQQQQQQQDSLQQFSILLWKTYEARESSSWSNESRPITRHMWPKVLDSQQAFCLPSLLCNSSCGSSQACYLQRGNLEAMVFSTI